MQVRAGRHDTQPPANQRRSRPNTTKYGGKGRQGRVTGSSAAAAAAGDRDDFRLSHTHTHTHTHTHGRWILLLLLVPPPPPPPPPPSAVPPSAFYLLPRRRKPDATAAAAAASPPLATPTRNLCCGDVRGRARVARILTYRDLLSRRLTYSDLPRAMTRPDAAYPY
ncbi:hypothetical protein E2C01_042798 [Portunus trituberculatus]|uniref:Uncharacterized protein n=1 Tax=Portunus trituberculatus TaxID=210409 RepID=A0A5B7FUK4_PORTR|nr:hypothetical protein [Portunus trituberculatus]